PAGHKVGPGLIATAYEHVSDRQLAEHLAEEITQIGAVRDGFQIWLVPFFELREIQPVQVRVVEEVTLASPHLVVHLSPLDLRSHANLDIGALQYALTGFRRYHCRRNDPCRSLTEEHLFAVERNLECAYAVEHFVKLALLEIE